MKRAEEVNWLYTASYGSVDGVGTGLEIIGKRAGFAEKTKVHGLGDGAIWVREQLERAFGCQMNFTIDFFHLCDYLSSAADIFSEKKAEWMNKAKASLKKGQIKKVLAELKKEQEQYPDHKGLIDCIRYIENRKSQFKYDEALAQGLPIGSGKIESAHRNIIQQRLKKPGAWWKEDAAEAMINLRVLRANGDWENFWREMSYEGRAA